MSYFMEGSLSNNFDAASMIPNMTPWTLLTVTPLLSPRRGLIYFNQNLKDGLFTPFADHLGEKDIHFREV